MSSENGASPPWVGTAEAAEILGVEVPRITRWRKGGKMPPTVADLAATPVWRREDIEVLRDNGAWKVSATRGGKQPKKQPFAGTSEAAVLIGELLERTVDKSQIGRWRRAGTFPDAEFALAATPVWRIGAIEKFARSRQKPPAAA